MKGFMAKPSYKVPDTIDKTHFDTEIYLRAKNGVGLNAFITIRVMLLFMSSIFILFFLFRSTFLKHGGLFNQAIFAITWLSLSAMICRVDKTRRYGYERMMTLFSYVSKGARTKKMKATDPALELRKLTGIENVRMSDGLVTFFKNDAFGYVFRVTGNASVLMFDKDKNQVIDQTSNWFRQLPDGDLNIIIDTGRESQKVKRQLGAIVQRQKQRNKNARFRSRGLDALNRQIYTVMDDYVGEHFKSLHQYIILTSTSPELLREAHLILMDDVQTNGQIVKRFERLEPDEVVSYFSEVF